MLKIASYSAVRGKIKENLSYDAEWPYLACPTVCEEVLDILDKLLKLLKLFLNKC